MKNNKKQIIKILLLIFFIPTTLISCLDEGVIDYDLVILFDKQIDDVDKNDVLPENIIKLLMYHDIAKTDTCKIGGFFTPNITFKRMDIDKKIMYGNPAKENSFGKAQFKENIIKEYDTKLFKTPLLLVKKEARSVSKHSIKKKGTILTIDLFDEDKKYDNLIKTIDGLLCSGKKVITIRITESASVSPPQEEYTTQADNFCEQRNYKDAIKLYQQILAVDSSNAHASDMIKKCENFLKIQELITKADALYNDKKCKKAIDFYKEVLVLSPENGYAQEQIRKCKGVKPPTPTPPRGGFVVTGPSTMKSNYAKYEGGILNKKMHGTGSLVFTRTHELPVRKNSGKSITVTRGNKIVGVFHEGYFVSGTMYNSKGKKIKSIYIGR